jgi:hypothetical protein
VATAILVKSAVAISESAIFIDNSRYIGSFPDNWPFNNTGPQLVHSLLPTLFSLPLLAGSLSYLVRSNRRARILVIACLVLFMMMCWLSPTNSSTDKLHNEVEILRRYWSFDSMHDWFPFFTWLASKLGTSGTDTIFSIIVLLLVTRQEDRRVPRAPAPWRG